MAPRQMDLFNPSSVRPFDAPFPSTRYQGSKRALVSWIGQEMAALSFDRMLDAFGGTGVVSHFFKMAGKQVIYNDLLAFNHTMAVGLIENVSETLTEADIDLVLSPADDSYPDFIQRTFKDIYFTDAENAWLDQVNFRISARLGSVYKQALARFALFQACIIKRPYNLFHRANLYMRTAQVQRSFGNKTTWDTPFETHFRAFVKQANASVFDNGRVNRALCGDVMATPTDVDLVYIDPPYLNAKGVGVDYRDFYHFLEGMTAYECWAERIDYGSKHRRLLPHRSVWNDSRTIAHAFDDFLGRFQNATFVVSYRDDGIPSSNDLIAMLKRHRPQVSMATLPKQYVLSKQRSHELLLMANR